MHEANPPEASAGQEDHCPHCGHAVRSDARVCPNCLTVIYATCSHCGGPLTMKWKRTRVSSAIRLALEIAGIVIFVFTMGSLIGPIALVLLVGVAQLFGYEMRPHHYCAQCRKATHVHV